MRYYLGGHNCVSQEWQEDGSVIITLSKRGDKNKHIYRVKNLYKENEEVLEHKVVETGKGSPAFIQNRIKKAKREIQSNDSS